MGVVLAAGHGSVSSPLQTSVFTFSSHWLCVTVCYINNTPMYGDSHDNVVFSPPNTHTHTLDLDLLHLRDRLFSQCVTALVTSFAHHLLAAARGRLNNAVEYEKTNVEASQRWLQLISRKGMLLHMQSTMQVQQVSESSEPAFFVK